MILIIMLVYYCLALMQRKQQDQNLRKIAEEVEEQNEQDPTQDQSTDEIINRISNKYKDLYAILQIPGTKINYPVAYIPGDSEYYLHHSLEGEETISGTPFLAGECFEGCGNLIIYGHHMSDGSVFAGLLDYSNSDFLREHTRINLELIDQRLKNEYEVVASFYSSAHDHNFDYYNYYDLTDPARKSEFVDKVKRYSLYQSATPIDIGDEFLTLSTCSYHVKDGRFVVVAKKIN